MKTLLLTIMLFAADGGHKNISFPVTYSEPIIGPSALTQCQSYAESIRCMFARQKDDFAFQSYDFVLVTCADAAAFSEGK